MLNKQWEKILLIICASWQFIDGALTIALGFIKPAKISELQAFSNSVPISSFNGSVGTLFILIGMVNLMIALYFLKHGTINKFIISTIVVEVLFSYFCMDIISVATLAPALIILSLKRKKQNLTQTN